jgi:1,4-dihydroxy-2-naphthoate octaprenyltransferase
LFEQIVSVPLNPWISAARPRTLPLALASIGMGAFLAASVQQFRWEVFLLSALTTVFLQVLSNLANDYGDSVHGADHAGREGPARAVQSGAITPRAMRLAIGGFAVLSLASGITLLWWALPHNGTTFALFLGLGALAILAAITYTSGKRPYGYAGFGDVSVLLFFGLVGVMGSYYLHTLSLRWALLLPALSCGFFSTAVLNVNNIRDLKTDAQAGKRSIPVRLGRPRAVAYHWALLGAGTLCSVAYGWLNYDGYYQWLFLLCLPLLIRNGRAVQHRRTAAELDPYLKQMALTTLLYVLTFGIGLLL